MLHNPVKISTEKSELGEDGAAAEHGSVQLDQHCWQDCRSTGTTPPYPSPTSPEVVTFPEIRWHDRYASVCEHTFGNTLSLKKNIKETIKNTEQTH